MSNLFSGLQHPMSVLENAFANVNEHPVIVMGNQKSGTSAIAHLLADFGGLSKTIDIPPLWPPVLGEIMKGHMDFDQVVRRNKWHFSAELIKEPNLTFFADQVVERFPAATYVFIVRDPRENIRSLLHSRNIPGHLEKLENRHLPTSPQHRIVADERLWGKGSNYIDVLARRWNKAVQSYFRFQHRMHLVWFEDFLADKYRCIAQLAEDLGIPERRDIGDRLDVQYQPRGNREVSWETFFGPANLACIEQTCGSFMSKLGYEEARPAAESSP